MPKPLGIAGLLALLLSMGGCAVTTNESDEPVAITDDSLRESASPWTSPEACESAVRDGKIPRRARGVARVATWNLRWFPDGTMPGGGGAPKPTNLAWVACAILALDVDVLALEEILTHARAKAALDTVLQRMNDLSGGDWRAEISPCPGDRSQHQGFVFDASRTSASRLRNFDWRERDHCNMTRRPAFVGRFALASGLDVDLAAVHAKSGVDGESYDTRKEALGQLRRLAESRTSETGDGDVVVLGDFNTMGSDDRKTDATAEIAELDAHAKAGGFRRIRSDLFCSEYSRGEGGLLDHVLVSSAMTEGKATSRATISGYCAALRCRPTSTMPRAYTELSDHCPLVVELDARDLD